MKELVLITGGAGFIGSHTADLLKQSGYRVRIFDNLKPPVHEGRWPQYLQKKGFELLRGDVREKKDWEKALRGVSYVYHLAAYQDQRLDFSTFFETNTTSTALLYEVAVEKKLPLKKVVVASSQFVYGDGLYECLHGAHALFSPELRSLAQFQKKEWDILCPHGKKAKQLSFKEEQLTTPTNSYGLSKCALEMTALRLGKTYNLPTVALRYSIVQGTRQSPRNLYSGALRIFVSQALAGVPLTVYEDGLSRRDFVNVKDVAAANLLVLKKKQADFQIFNVGGGRAYTVINFAKAVKKITKSESKITLGSFRRTDTRHAVSDISKIKKLGWHPRFSIHDSIAEYVTWFQQEGFDKKINRARLLSLKEGITR